MKKYKLINNLTKEETLCDLVTIDEFDYYVTKAVCVENDALYHPLLGIGISKMDGILCFHIPRNNATNTGSFTSPLMRNFPESLKVIATNNPNIDIPQITNDIEKLSENIIDKILGFKTSYIKITEFYSGVKIGYNKAKETHPFTEQDTIDFTEWTQNPDNCLYIPKIKTWYYKTKKYSTRELLQIFKELQPKTIYYE